MLRWIVVLLPLAPLVLLLAVVRQAAVGPQAVSQNTVVPLIQVVYVVRGDASSAAVTYSNANGAVERRTVTLPWDLRLERPAGSAAYVAAQHEDAGWISCEILVDDRNASESTADGESAVASCSSRVP